MRKRERGTSGLARRTVIAALAMAVLVVGSMWGKAEATAPTRAEHLATFLESPAGHSRKLMAVEELRHIDTAEAREKLQQLAASSDEDVARMAIAALGRASFEGARSTLDSIYEDTQRSTAARGVALAVICAQESRAGHTWASFKTWVRDHDGGISQLQELETSLKARFWANEVSDE